MTSSLAYVANGMSTSDGAPRSCENQPVLSGVQEVVDAIKGSQTPNHKTCLGTVAASGDKYDPGLETVLVVGKSDSSGGDTKPTKGLQGAGGVELQVPENLQDSIEDQSRFNPPGVRSGPDTVKYGDGLTPPDQRSVSDIGMEGYAIRINAVGEKAGSQGSRSPERQIGHEGRELLVTKTPTNASTDMDQVTLSTTTAASTTNKAPLGLNTTPLEETSTPGGHRKRSREEGQTSPECDGYPSQRHSGAPCAHDNERSVKGGRRQLNFAPPRRGKDALGYRTISWAVKGIRPRQVVGSEEKNGGGVGIEGAPREDDYSTIVWYRTIVACLMAPS